MYQNKAVIDLQEKWIAGDSNALVKLSAIIDAMARSKARKIVLYDLTLREEVFLKSSQIVLSRFLDNRCFRVEYLGGYVSRVCSNVLCSLLKKKPRIQEDCHEKPKIDGLLFIHENPKIAVLLYNAVLFGPVIKKIDKLMGRRWCYDHAQELKHVFDMTRRGKDEIKALYKTTRRLGNAIKNSDRSG